MNKKAQDAVRDGIDTTVPLNKHTINACMWWQLVVPFFLLFFLFSKGAVLTHMSEQLLVGSTFRTLLKNKIMIDIGSLGINCSDWISAI